MKRELGVGYCGLICGLCSSNTHCGGCKNGDCPGKETCKCFICCEQKGCRSCAECDQFPCTDSILKKLRIRTFCELISQYGEEHILDCLERNEKEGVVYHYPGKEIGDYDKETKEEIINKVLHKKMD